MRNENTLKLLLLLFLVSCQKLELKEDRIIQIGERLTSTDFTNFNSDFPDIVTLGNSLKNKMIELQKNTTKFKINAKTSYYSLPFDVQVDAILSITSNHRKLEIKLKHDKELDKFHILGFATLYDMDNTAK